MPRPDPSTTTGLTAEQFAKKLESFSSPEQKQGYHRYFTFDDEPAAGADGFIGAKMGQVFALAKEFINMPPAEIEMLLESPIHEIRAGGCSIMGKQASSRKTPESRRKELYDLYLRRHDRVNAWDLVDLAAHKVVGSYLYDFNQPRDILYMLARSQDTWGRRTAIVSTLYFTGKGEVDDAFAIAEILLNDDQDLIHKATGWALREAGKNDLERLVTFLDQYAATMPRVTLRYAIEHFDKDQRDYYLGLKKSG